MNDQDPATGLALADLFRFASACYYEPGPVFAEENLFGSMLDAARVADPELAGLVQRLGDEFAHADMQALLLDYTRLFLGPVDAPAKPYGSVWLERGGVFGETTRAVTDLYAQGGFELSDDFMDLPDHLCVELEFLYVLLFRQHQALQAGDGQAQEDARGLAQRLLDEHLRRWVEPFSAAVADNAQTGFYRELAAFTRQLVIGQAQRVLAR